MSWPLRSSMLLILIVCFQFSICLIFQSAFYTLGNAFYSNFFYDPITFWFSSYPIGHSFQFPLLLSFPSFQSAQDLLFLSAITPLEINFIPCTTFNIISIPSALRFMYLQQRQSPEFIYLPVYLTFA